LAQVQAVLLRFLVTCSLLQVVAVVLGVVAALVDI
jgi:hypothetical protein